MPVLKMNELKLLEQSKIVKILNINNAKLPFIHIAVIGTHGDANPTAGTVFMPD